jgi:hypothetical protein
VRDVESSMSAFGQPLSKWLVCLLGIPHRRSPNLHTAIDDDIDSGDVRTVIGGQEQSDVRHFLGPAETSEQRLAEHRARSFGVLQLFSRLIGFNQARGDGIRANTVFSPLHRELPRHPDDPCLGRRMRQ